MRRGASTTKRPMSKIYAPDVPHLDPDMHGPPSRTKRSGGKLRFEGSRHVLWVAQVGR